MVWNRWDTRRISSTHHGSGPVAKKDIGWLAIVILLLAVILAGTGSVWARHHGTAVIDVREPAPALDTGRVFIGGGVAAPGWYPLRAGDTIDDLIAAAGGLLPGTASDQVSLTVGRDAENPQRVNINTAATWLLAALPGIGETKARAIIDYREAGGLFRDTAEIMNVPGIGRGTYDTIRDLITVGE
jgi:competence protein ComEA